MITKTKCTDFLANINYCQCNSPPPQGPLAKLLDRLTLGIHDVPIDIPKKYMRHCFRCTSKGYYQIKCLKSPWSDQEAVTLNCRDNQRTAICSQHIAITYCSTVLPEHCYNLALLHSSVLFKTLPHYNANHNVTDVHISRREEPFSHPTLVKVAKQKHGLVVQ